MEKIEKINAIRLLKFEFNKNKKLKTFGENETQQHELSLSMTPMKNVVNNDSMYTCVLSVALHVKKIKADQITEIESSSEYKQSFSMQDNDVFTIFLEYSVFFTLKVSDSDLDSEPIQKELIEYLQPYIRRDVQYISIDSDFDANSFPMQLVK